METSGFILDTFEYMQQAVSTAVDGLNSDELTWCPGPGTNSIGFILWHQLRWEDISVQNIIQGRPQVWVSDKWYEKLNLPESPQDDGYGYTAEQVAAFHVPELKDLLGYAEATRARTVEYLRATTPGKFDEVIQTPFLGELTIGQIFATLLCEITQHIGQIAYLRGLQRGLNK